MTIRLVLQGGSKANPSTAHVAAAPPPPPPLQPLPPVHAQNSAHEDKQLTVTACCFPAAWVEWAAAACCEPLMVAKTALRQTSESGQERVQIHGETHLLALAECQQRLPPEP
jgi:hypothetical protein